MMSERRRPGVNLGPWRELPDGTRLRVPQPDYVVPRGPRPRPAARHSDGPALAEALEARYEGT